MTKWKLVRHTNKNEVYSFSEGEEITVGRGINNAITLSSIVISRNHCVIKFQEDHALITDLKSSNGTYIGEKKIPQCTPNIINNLDIIGFGWTIGAPVVNINDNEKFVFQLVKEEPKSYIARIKFEDDICDENKNTQYGTNTTEQKAKESGQPFKRKLNVEDPNSKVRKLDENEVIHILSDSENEEKPIIKEEPETLSKPSEISEPLIIKKELQLSSKTYGEEEKSLAIKEEPPLSSKDQIKFENGYLEYEAFNVKQEYLGSNEECIEIDSESDSDSEHWFLRLSQCSPGKPFTKLQRKSDNKVPDINNSYSQVDDFVNCINNDLIDDENEHIMHDIISIPPQPMETEEVYHKETIQDNTDIPNNLTKSSGQSTATKENICEEIRVISEIDGIHTEPSNIETISDPQVDTVKRAQMIEPLAQESKKRSKPKGPPKDSPKLQKADHKSKIDTTISLKEERKRKLKDIAKKEKETDGKVIESPSNSHNKPTTKVKVTASNRGAFLTDIQAIVKPMKRKDSPKSKKIKDTAKCQKAEKKVISNDVENNLKPEKSTHKKRISKLVNKSITEIPSPTTSSNDKIENCHQDSRLPLKSLKPLTESEKSGKPFSKVEPLPPKESKKRVRFSEESPKVYEFEITPGNHMKKIYEKKSLVDVQQRPVFSLEKITLIKILRWNPHWLEEQVGNSDPPPILGHNSQPMSVLHSFVDHKQYIQLMGDLLLMEIWECLSVAFMKVRIHSHYLEMMIDSLPPVPSNDRVFDLFNLSVKISMPSNEARNAPKVGEVIMASFGPENASNQRFLYVHNVRCLPPRPGSKIICYNVSLHAIYTDKMRCLKSGDVIRGKVLAYINKELTLFEAMEYLAISPLSSAILKPEPRHFVNKDIDIDITSQWTNDLNPSQKTAVKASVIAAQSNRPSINMVQGPPGTGKSSVICATVMAYFYDSSGARRHKRGKILICATSNAAVDELVLRLLNIRQKLPKEERFRMVRVGRPEAMHPRAFDVSSQQLAQRDAAARQVDPQAPGVAEEISHLEAKMNMWKTAAQEAKDPVRIAYCESRIDELNKRMMLVRAGNIGSASPSSVTAVERRIIEGADIVVTTLASAHNHKMRGLKGRIALCIIDEAGQAIEPETLIPLTLDITKITLIGDPQQLPGYICSQRAKKHGLGESLFFRLTSSHWPNVNPVILLNLQYRMHPAIANYPNRAFYDGQIQTVAPARPKLDVAPYMIIGISSGDKGQGPSGANETEAWGVSRLVLALHKVLRPLNLNVAVITPYNAHKELVKSYIKQMQEPGSPCVEVNTVDGFQGQERDVVVVSIARSCGVGFLTDAGRMNVMLTRARHALLVCLNPNALLKNYQWRTLIEDAQKRKVYRDLPNRLCRPVSSGRPPSEESLEDTLQILRSNL